MENTVTYAGWKGGMGLGRETRTDTERLNWLERNQVGLFRVERDEYVPCSRADRRYELETEFLGWCVSSRVGEWSTVREAIDAAMDGT